MSPPRTVVLIGKVGHGKTRILNTLCDTDFPSLMSSRSCTKGLQHGMSRNHRILTIDTPGFYSSEEIGKHIAEQRFALENTALCGIYIVVKLGRADDMAETLNKVMDFVGDDDVRVIITFADFAPDQQGYDADATKARLSELLDVPLPNIIAVGKSTNPDDIEGFVESTLHEPRKFEVSKDQLAHISSFNVGARRFTQTLEEVYLKIEAAESACHKLMEHGRSYGSDVAIIATRKATKQMVNDSKVRITEDAKELMPEQQSLLLDKFKFSLLSQLNVFLDMPGVVLASKQCWTTAPVYLTVNFCQHESGWGIEYQFRGTTIPTEQVPIELNNDSDMFMPVDYTKKGKVFHNRKRTKALQHGRRAAKIDPINSVHLLIEGGECLGAGYSNANRVARDCNGDRPNREVPIQNDAGVDHQGSNQYAVMFCKNCAESCSIL